MRQLIVKQLDYDLTPVAGLALVGHYLKAVQPVLGRPCPSRAGVANGDIVRSYVGYVFTGYRAAPLIGCRLGSSAGLKCSFQVADLIAIRSRSANNTLASLKTLREAARRAR